MITALALAACGGASKSSSASSTSAANGSTGTAPGASSSSVPAGDIATVNSTAISAPTYTHWMTAALTSAAASSTSTAATIIPLYPPDFSLCLSQIKAKDPSLASSSTTTKVADCKQEFTTTNADVLQFLIQAHRYETYAAQLGILVSQAAVSAAYDTERKASFPTQAKYQVFLKETGETAADLMFRTRVNLIFEALLKHFGATQPTGTQTTTTKATTAAETKLNTATEKLYKAKTFCAANYVMDDCTASS